MTSIKQKINEYFFVHPTAKLRVRHIEREVKVALPSAIRYAKELEDEKILKSVVVAGVKVYTGDRASREFLVRKKLFNVYSLFSSGLVNFLIREYSNPTIVVFGSYSKGEDVEGSDIDFYIETAKNVSGRNVEQFEKKLMRKLQFFQYRKISDVENKELANNIVNGIALNGFVEVFNWRREGKAPGKSVLRRIRR